MNTLVRIFITVLALIIISSCSQRETEESIRGQINNYRKEADILNQKIADLERQLAILNETDEHSEGVLIEVIELTYRPFKHFIRVSGTAEAVSEAFISPEVSGQLRDIYVKEGDLVEKGQLLARLNNEVTQSSIAEVQSALDLATTLFEKQQRLWDKGIGSEVEYLNARNNKESLEQKLVTLKAQLDMGIIRSPVSGVVDKIYHKKGELAMPGFQLMQIIDLEEIYINADVAERYLAQVKEGETVGLEFPVYPDLTMEASIYRKGNVINPNNRTFTVQVKLKNPDRMLKPNILSVLHINDFSADSALVIPSGLIKQDITGYYVYIVRDHNGKNIVSKTYIEPGKSYQGETMVTHGLEAGQQVVVQGYNQVADGTEVNIQSTDAS
ncbi:MAG: efflux RND transporter periplasmic adaptor subunit [Bacteroidales bacterium]